MKYQELPTPCYVVEEEKIVKNIKILQDVMEQTGAHILLAQKAFPCITVILCLELF